MCWSAVAFNPAAREARGRIQSVTHHHYLHKHVLNFICMINESSEIKDG